MELARWHGIWLVGSLAVDRHGTCIHDIRNGPMTDGFGISNGWLRWAAMATKAGTFLLYFFTPFFSSHYQTGN